MKDKRNLLLILILILVSFGVFANTLANDFVWDDVRFILDHPFIKDFSNIGYLFSFGYFSDPQKMLSLGMYNIARPAWVISAMIDYKIWGPNPFGHHLTNVILHSISVVLLFILLNLIFKDRQLSFLSALIFALHPIHTETINVATFRIDILAFIFMALSFIVFVKALDRGAKKKVLEVSEKVHFDVIASSNEDSSCHCDPDTKCRGKQSLRLRLLRPPRFPRLRSGQVARGPRNDRRRNRLRLFAMTLFQNSLLLIFLSFVFFFLSIFSKSMAITLPLLITLYLYLFVPKEKIRENKALLVSYFSVVAGMIIAFLFLQRTHFFYGSADIAVSLAQKSIFYRFAVMSLVFVKYIRLLFLPVGLCADYGLAFLRSEYFLDALFPAALISGILIWAFMRRKKEKIFSFAIFWFFITLIPVSNIIPIVNIIAERYLYIPSVGFCIILAHFFVKLYTAKSQKRAKSQNNRKNAKFSRFCGVSFLIILCFYAFQAVRRNFDWKNNLAIWTKTVRQSPDNFRVRNNLGKAYLTAGQIENAIEEFNESLAINPENYIAHANLGICYNRLGMQEKAKIEYQRALEIKPTLSPAAARLWPIHIGMGNDYLKEGKLDEAMEEYLASIRIDPNFAPAYYNLGNIFLEKEMLDEAEDMYKKATRLDKYYAEAYSNLGVVYAKEGKIEAAKENWNRALKFKPSLKSAKENLERLEK